MSSTNTSTFTTTDAQYLASKIAADLRQFKSFYGEPSEDRIDKYVKELIILLKDKYIASIDYGFKKNDTWILAISYTVNTATGRLVDDNPGRIPAGRDVSGCTFSSFLRYSYNFTLLSAEEKEKIKKTLPFNRETGDDPQDGLYGVEDKSYSSGGQLVNRKIFG